MTLKLHRDGVIEDLYYFLNLENYQEGGKI
jgi:hypothetical protein